MPLCINQETIPDSLVDEEFQAIKAHYEQMGRVSCCERDSEFRGYARDNIVARVLLNQEAERRYPDVDPAEVAAAAEKVMAEHGGRAAFFAHMGLSEEQEDLVRQDVAAGLRMDKLLGGLWQDWSGPSPEEEQAWYAAHMDDYLTPVEIRATHLFKQVERVEERETIYAALCALRVRARAGEDFDAIAVEHTDKEDKLVDLGWFGRGEFGDEFDTILFSLDDGEVSPVFASHWGFHLAKVTGRRPPEPRPFASVQEAVRERLTAAFRQECTMALVETLKAAAVIADTD